MLLSLAYGGVCDTIVYMVSRIMFWIVCIVCAASLGSLVFFLLFVNPDYIGIFGFAVFYASLFAALWSIFLLIGSGFIHRRRVRASLRHSLVRRTGLCAAGVIGIFVFSHLDVLTWYAALLLVCGLIIADHRFAGR